VQEQKKHIHSPLMNCLIENKLYYVDTLAKTASFKLHMQWHASDSILHLVSYRIQILVDIASFVGVCMGLVVELLFGQFQDSL
jgi:hypothetical protein